MLPKVTVVSLLLFVIAESVPVWVIVSDVISGSIAPKARPNDLGEENLVSFSTAETVVSVSMLVLVLLFFFVMIPFLVVLGCQWSALQLLDAMIERSIQKERNHEYERIMFEKAARTECLAWHVKRMSWCCDCVGGWTYVMDGSCCVPGSKRIPALWSFAWHVWRLFPLHLPTFAVQLVSCRALSVPEPTEGHWAFHAFKHLFRPLGETPQAERTRLTYYTPTHRRNDQFPATDANLLDEEETNE